MAIMRVCITSIAVLLVTGQIAAAQPPTLTNARVTKLAAAGTLDTQVRGLVAAAAEATWIGWIVPASKPGSDGCCWSSVDGVTRGGCQLETAEARSTSGQTSGSKKVELEAGRQLVVLVRAEIRAVQKVVSYSDACELDAGGLPVEWIDGVKPAESVGFLSRLAADDGSDGKLRQPANGALSALGRHADESAVRTLVSLAQSASLGQLRSQALFWLGQQGGPKATAAILGAIENDADASVRRQAVFALGQLPEAESVPKLIELARTDKNADVRSQALFWLAQKAGQKATATIVGAIQNDPDTAVKRQAVFALSQLPKDDGVPKLIEVARTNKNGEVRKQAIFWLGQSKDPRALAFFREVLLK